MTTTTNLIDWNTDATALIVARREHGILVGTWPIGTSRGSIARDLASMRMPPRTRIRVRREMHEVCKETGALIGA